ncbi:MAG: type I-E CRISPR-associated protein Cas5/CasD [Vicinamibacterales bacterium]
MSVLLLRLEGPLQAWSAQGKLGVRDTEREPTKSGVIGLIGAAMGMQRDDEEGLATLAALRMAVRVDRAGILLHDYHTAGGGRFRGELYQVFGTGRGDAVPTHRYYLQHASFVAALEGDASLTGRLAGALASPRYPLFLGRRSCPPSVPPLIGVVSGDRLTALSVAPFAENPDPPPYRMIIEADGGEGDARYDVPLSFAASERRYGRRYVVTDWLQSLALAKEELA